MKLARPLAASGVALAAVAATLGAVAPAQAATAATYSCTVLGSTVPVQLSVDAPLPTTAAAGIPVGAGLLHVAATATTSATLGHQLEDLLHADGSAVKDFASTIGNVTVRVPATFGKGTYTDTNHDGDTTDDTDLVTFAGVGTNQAFLQPAAGTFDILLPKTFTITPTNGGHDITGAPTVACSTATPVKLGTIKVDKQLGHVSAKAAKKAVKKAKAKLAVTVANDWSAKGGVQVGGTVVVKKGKKVVGRAAVVNGKATVKLKKLKKGVNKVTVSYLGDAYTAAAKAPKTYKVKVK